MAYKHSVYLKARDLMEKRRRKAESEQSARHSAAVARCPEIAKVESEMASHGAEAIKAVGMGGDVEQYILSIAKKNLEMQEKRKKLLLENGLPEDYLDMKYTCSICKDTGSHDGFYCRCYRELVREVARKELSDNSPSEKCKFSTFRLSCYPEIEDAVVGVSQREHMKGVFEFCKDYASDFSPTSTGLFMYGLTGLGKTHLSLSIANEVIDKGYDVYYGSIQTIMNTLESEHFGRNKSSESIKDDIFSCDLLIIDDLGVEFTTQFTLAELYNIINTRALRSLPTIISTNLDVVELEEKYGQRIASRILGGCLPVYFCGRDIRQMG